MSGHSLRNEQLDGLRGYAAVMVVYFHAILGVDPKLVSEVLYRNYSQISGLDNWLSKISLVILNGQTAVVLFFIMSGAVLFESLLKDNAPLALRIRNFFIRRFFRIYPALFACLLACWIAFNAFSTPRSGEDLLLNLLLYETKVNGATWTLGVEAWGAVLLVFCFMAYLKYKEIGLIVVALLFGCLYLSPFNGYLLQFRMFIYCFALGALIPTALGRAVISRIPNAAWPFLLVGTIIARHTIQETIAALLIGLIYYRRAGGFGEFLAKPVSVFLGTVSYSLYLFNVLFLEIINHQLSAVGHLGLHPAFVGLVSGTLITLVTIPVAYGSFLYIEQPFVRFGRWITSGRSIRTSAKQQASPAEAL